MSLRLLIYSVAVACLMLAITRAVEFSTDTLWLHLQQRFAIGVLAILGCTLLARIFLVEGRRRIA